MKKNIARLFCVAALGLPMVLAAQNLPAAATVLDGYVKAMGGQAAFDRVKTRVVYATITVPLQGITMKSTSYAAQDGRSYTCIESPMFGKIESGVNGETVWSVHPMAGARVLSGDEAKLQANVSQLDQLVHWKKSFTSVETVGIDTVEGLACIHLVAKVEGLPDQSFYIDPASHALVKMVMTVDTPQGAMRIASSIGDYRNVDGVKLPFRTRIIQAGQQILSVTDSVKQNGTIPDSIFTPPAAIQALLSPSETE